MASSQSHASIMQQGIAVNMRNHAQRNPIPMSRSDHLILCQIGHSSDDRGAFRNTPNPYRDLSSQYDARAQQQLVRINNQYFGGNDTNALNNAHRW